MRRFVLACLILLGATAAFAANPYYLDRAGVLWKGTATPDGLLLTGERDGSTVVSSIVPFPLAISGANDSQIQVAADDLTGKVAVVWQRNWNFSGSEIMLAVWHNGSWERTQRLSGDLVANPRNPEIRLTEVTLSAPDPDFPNDPAKTTLVQDSYLHVVWWEGTDQSHGTYALLRLSGDSADQGTLTEQNLDTYAGLGIACPAPVPPAVLEHPVFASAGAADRALLFFGSQRQCFFQLLQISFVLDTPPATQTTNSGGMTAISQRRRSVPIFGLKKVFPMTQELSMDNVRVVLGNDLNPVAYRVNDGTVEYVTYSDQGWSLRRTLAVANGLTLDQAIPLIENLAR
ncbi:MAG: hypothetical protein B7X11_00030 [Acidobacteria bacterium 37-65-4]|nr:MAG: hypothetical protein B7X11_00030 [Acidobacteria bacterium 37-65-4]HQT95989.1 hypothetical protein [Thermoanaerobaculaceae bacterium]